MRPIISKCYLIWVNIKYQIGIRGHSITTGTREEGWGLVESPREWGGGDPVAKSKMSMFVHSRCEGLKIG